METGLSLSPATLNASRERGLDDGNGSSSPRSENSTSSTPASTAAPVSSATGADQNLVTIRANDPLATSASREQTHSTEGDQRPGSGARLSDEERQQVEQLARRDREVRAHEAAHAAAGGALASAPTYSFQRGPDGRMYAVGGELGIDTAAVPGDPQATIDKARTIIQAATAPANPSAQDLRAAAQARAMLIEAEAELSRARAAEQPGGSEERDDAATDEQPSELDRQRTEASERAERRDQLSDEMADRLERSRKSLQEFANELDELNRRLARVQQQMNDSGAISPEQAIGTLLDTNA